MQKLALYHRSESTYSFAISQNEVVLRFRVAKEDKDLKIAVLYNDNKYKFYEIRKEKEMELKYVDDLFSYFEIHLKLNDKRLGYIFKIYDKEDNYFYHENGIIKESNYDFNFGYFDFFQIPYINKEDVIEVVDFMKNRVFYQIFVERFNKGNEKKDLSYITNKWGEKPSGKSFFGGDLKGVIEKLEYIKGLGINAIYLTPIFKSPSNHKYDTIDYFAIDENFGDIEDLKELVKKAHNLGIKIILDAVYNHCSNTHPFFKDVLEKGKDSIYYDWFLIKDIDKKDYEVFSDVSYMPKFNFANRKVKDYLLKISAKYIKECDIDGYRLDVADELSHSFLKEFRQVVKGLKKDFVIIGENWHDSRAFLRGDEFDGVMNYGLTKIFLDYFANKKLSIEDVKNRLISLLMRNIDQINVMNLNLLDSHDTPRLFTLVRKEKDTFLSSLAMLFMYIGTPCIYYGTEFAMEGMGDPDCRRCFEWDFSKNDMKLHELVKDIISIRNYKVFKTTNIKIYIEDENLVITRFDDKTSLQLILGENIDFDDENILVSSKDFSNGKINFKLKIVSL